MIERLLGDFEIDLGELSKGTAIATRRMLGGTNRTFYVVDRCPSLISNFKMATAKLVAYGKLYV